MVAALVVMNNGTATGNDHVHIDPLKTDEDTRSNNRPQSTLGEVPRI